MKKVYMRRSARLEWSLDQLGRHVHTVIITIIVIIMMIIIITIIVIIMMMMMTAMTDWAGRGPGRWARSGRS